jgi:hypothetical protein
MMALELVALASFAFSRPVLSTFGDAPEWFISRAASRADIVGFALVVALVPAAVLTLVGLASRVLGDGARHMTHIALVAACAGLGAWRAVHDPTGGRTWAMPALAVGAAGAGLVGVLRARAGTRHLTARYLRFASIGGLVFLAHFLWLSPVGRTLLTPAATVDPEATAAVAQALGSEPPPVVVVLLDELPTASLLDGRGGIDGDLYPNFAAFAAESTWYRNHTTVSPYTVSAVPAILTGRYPEGGSLAPADPENLFTLLADRYDLVVEEPVTRLCPDRACPRETPSAISALVSDAAGWWRHGLTFETAAEIAVPTLPGATGPDRYERAVRLVDDLDLPGGDRPVFAFLHLFLPHGPWELTDDGSLYDRPDTTPGLFGPNWTRVGHQVGRQRHILQLQATDALLGRLVDRLRAADAYDDALVVVTADHGVSFVPERPTRDVVAGNEEHILWTPLLVKAPGQTQVAVDDGNVLSVDIVPTIADLLGVEMPWEVDGVPARTASVERPNDVKPIVGSDDRLAGRPVEGRPYAEIGRGPLFERVLAADPLPAAGPDAAWRPTRYGAWVGEDVGALAQRPAAGGTVTVVWPAGFDDIDTRDPLPLAVVAGTDVPVGSVVAFALDGRIASLGEVQDSDERGGKLVQAVLAPWLFQDGANDLEAFLVTGDASAPTLTPLAVAY